MCVGEVLTVSAALSLAVWCVRRGFLKQSTVSATPSWSTCLRASRRRNTFVLSWSTQLEETWWCTSTPTYSLSLGPCEWPQLHIDHTLWTRLCNAFSWLVDFPIILSTTIHYMVFWSDDHIRGLISSVPVLIDGRVIWFYCCSVLLQVLCSMCCSGLTIFTWPQDCVQVGSPEYCSQ